MTIKAAPAWLTSRFYLAQLCNFNGLVGSAVEVGTHQGGFAASFIRDWNGHTFYCVDPYQDYKEEWVIKQLYGDEKQDRQKDLAMAKEAVSKACKGQHHEFINLPSLEAVKRFRPGSLDFVYIDSSHYHDDVLADLVAWWDKVSPGGILAGHDVVCFGERDDSRNWGIQVQAAIMDFMFHLEQNGQAAPDCFIIIEQRDTSCLGGCWSYYFEKPK